MKLHCPCRASGTSTPKLLVALITAIAASVIIIFVWPTPYRYDHVKLSSGTFPVRISRMTGAIEMFSPKSGWVRQGGTAGSSKTQTALPQEELSKLDGSLVITNYGWIHAEIYNGTEKDIGSITVDIAIYDEQKTEILRRTYRLISTGGGPLSSSEFIADCGFTVKDEQSCKWQILSATWE